MTLRQREIPLLYLDEDNSDPALVPSLFCKMMDNTVQSCCDCFHRSLAYKFVGSPKNSSSGKI